MVRSLYKTILRLHRSLPKEARVLGDLYVKDEFRRHKQAKPEEVLIFMQEWSEYAITMANQLRPTNIQTSLNVGKDLSEAQLQAFRAEQIVQLYELFKVTPKGKSSDESI